MPEEKRFCSICGRQLKGDPQKEMHAECYYGLHKARIQKKQYAGDSERRKLYFRNLVIFFEATRKGVKLEC